MDSGNNIFITQTKTRDGDNEPSTDGVLSDILDMEMIFDVKNVVFSDISEDEMVVVGEALKAREINRYSRRLQEIDHNELVKGGLSRKVESKSKWAVSLFEQWQNGREPFKDKKLKDAMKLKILEIPNDTLNDLLCYFVVEVRNKSGEEYKPNILYELVLAIQHFIRQSGIFVSFLDDKCFEGMRNVLDTKIKELSSKGHGMAEKKIAHQKKVVPENTENGSAENVGEKAGENVLLRNRIQQKSYPTNTRISPETSCSRYDFFKDVLVPWLRFLQKCRTLGKKRDTMIDLDNISHNCSLLPKILSWPLTQGNISKVNVTMYAYP